MITVTETVNATALTLNGSERLSGIVFQLDVWDSSRDRQRTEEIAAEADRLLQNAGFKRTAGFTVNEKNLQRKTMRFSGTVDLVNFRVYTG